MSSKDKADKLLEKLLQGKEVHDLFAESMKKNLLVSGQTMAYWEDRFHIKVQTDNLTPSMCNQIDLRLLELVQEATFYYALASAKLLVLKQGNESTYRDKFFALVQEYKAGGKKLPAADTLEVLARVEMDDTNWAVSIADLEKGFWNNILEDLSSCRKIIENASFNNNTEAKLNGGYSAGYGK